MRFIVILLFLASKLISQTLTYSAFTPTVGDPVFSTYQIDSTGLAGLPGGNQTWNITPTGLHSKQTFTISSISTPSLNVKTRVTSGSDNLKDIGYTLNFDGVTWSALEIYRHVFKIANDTIDLKFNNGYPEYGLWFPSNGIYSVSGAVGTMAINNIPANTFPLSSPSYSFVQTSDGTGTINLPNMTYNNVVRINTTNTFVTSNNQIKLRQRFIDYYSLDAPKYPILSVQSYTVVSTSTVITSKTGTTAFIQENAITDINEINSETIGIVVFPNPVTSKVIISLKSDGFENSRLQILDYTGKEIYTTVISEKVFTLNTEDIGLSKGLYVFNFSTDKSSFSKKIIIQ